MHLIEYILNFHLLEMELKIVFLIVFSENLDSIQWKQNEEYRGRLNGELRCVESYGLWRNIWRVKVSW